jgi:hypothetical protein
MPGCALACVLPSTRTGRICLPTAPADVRERRRAYSVVWLNEGVVDGDDLDVVVLDAVGCS